jgi:hypothetical protein
MSIDPYSPHDTFVKTFLADPSHAGVVLRTLLPPEIASAVNWSTLRDAGAELHGENTPNTQTDLLFEATLAGEPAIVLLVVEHQSTADPMMPLRMLRTMTALWRRWEREHGGPLPRIVPLVLAHAVGGWTTARSMDALFPTPPEIPELDPYLPRFNLLLVDLTATERDQLRQWADTLIAQSAPAQAFMLRMLVVARDAPNAAGDTAAAVLADMAHVLEALVAHPAGREQFCELMYYVQLSVPTMTWDQARGILLTDAPGAASIMSSLREMVLAREFEQGVAKGRAEGVARVRAVLRRLLTAKFGELGPADEARLESATQEQLDTYADRLAFADTIDAVLAE